MKPRGRSYEILVNASTLLFVLFDYTTCFFVRSQSDELRVSQMVDLRFILHLSIDWTACRRIVITQNSSSVLPGRIGSGIFKEKLVSIVNCMRTDSMLSSPI